MIEGTVEEVGQGRFFIRTTTAREAIMLDQGAVLTDDFGNLLKPDDLRPGQVVILTGKHSDGNFVAAQLEVKDKLFGTVVELDPDHLRLRNGAREYWIALDPAIEVEGRVGIGSWVEVEVRRLSDGSLLAREIEVEEEEEDEDEDESRESRGEAQRLIAEPAVRVNDGTQGPIEAIAAASSSAGDGRDARTADSSAAVASISDDDSKPAGPRRTSADVASSPREQQTAPAAPKLPVEGSQSHDSDAVTVGKIPEKGDAEEGHEAEHEDSDEAKEHSGDEGEDTEDEPDAQSGDQGMEHEDPESPEAHPSDEHEDEDEDEDTEDEPEEVEQQEEDEEDDSSKADK
jgi:hypothetical protein